ncbi:N-acetylmuramoyl-L-alanine amidase [Novisyntrophococcus fermenticellae]|uniref:N-acetylmuramoyl-L-alanine amidase n=1 Tax=Novisyntrophococcus fermenticellae TaxID=2068655 RepID=UPI001E3A34A4|nr:N-acetylmuramoyl-L-alanine amidase [Novisyntrophococcus fermenticellae]
MAYRIMLDAGHGGDDPGATYQDRREKDDALRLTLEVGDVLEKNGIDILYTRTTDIFQTPFEKARIANDADVDYFISIHRETSPFPNQYSGVKAQVYDKVGTKFEMAENIISALSDLGFQNLGVSARPGLVLLRRTRMPAILLLVGYINNEEDNALFDSDIEGIAQSIANGILETLNPTNVRQTTFPAADGQNTAENTTPGSAYWTQMDEPLTDPWYDPEEMNQNMPAPATTDRNQNLNGSIPGYATQYPDSITTNRNQNTNGSIPWYMNQNNGPMNGSMNQNTGSMNGSTNQNTGSMPGSMNQNTGSMNGSMPQNTGPLPGSMNQNTGSMPGSMNQNTGSMNRNTGPMPGSMNQNTGSMNWNTGSMNGSMPQNTGPLPGSMNQNTGSMPGSMNRNNGSRNGSMPQNTGPLPGSMNQNTGSMPGSLNQNTGSVPGSINQNTGSMPGSMNQDFPDSMPGAQNQTIPASTTGPITQTIEPIPGYTNHNISSVPNYASHSSGSIPGNRNQNNSNPMPYNNGQNLSGSMQNNMNQGSTVTGETEAIRQQEQNAQENSSQTGTNQEADKDLTLYRVQVGLFRQRQNADNLLYELLERGYPAFLFCDGEFYKVQVGAYRQLGNAIIMERQLRKEGYSTLITT